jgi:hypothetical protein
VSLTVIDEDVRLPVRGIEEAAAVAEGLTGVWDLTLW